MKTALRILAILLPLAACKVGPRYSPPAPPAVPPAFKEAQGWKQAQPADSVLRGKWWEMYGDPRLNELEEQVAVSNQTVKQFEAQYRAAHATVSVARSQLYPFVTTAPSSSASSSSTLGRPGKVINNFSIPFQAAWEPDLWGRIHNTVEASSTSSQATAADLESARLSAQALLAQDYFLLRGVDADIQLLRETVDAYQKALEITTNRYRQGIDSQLDVAQAQTQLEITRARLIDDGVSRAQYEHAIAILAGKAPADLTIPPIPLDASPPSIPFSVPAALLERRPDIAGAERRVAAANAQIGIAITAYYPTLSLSAAAGLESNHLSSLFTWPARAWSVGGQLAQTLFDAGARRGLKAEAVAQYDATVAAYRQTVLNAFQEVEDNLAALQILEREEAQEKLAVDSAVKSREISFNQYRGGIVSYLEVIVAQATELSERSALIAIRTRRMTASALLIRALGGGWSTAQLPLS